VKKEKKQSNLDKKASEAMGKFEELKKQAKKLAETNQENVEKIKESIEGSDQAKPKIEL